MRLDYVQRHPNTAMNFAVVKVTGAFLGRLAHSLTEAELELSVIKSNRLGAPGVGIHLHDYTDANQCLLDALELVFPETAEDGVDIQDSVVAEIMDKSWENAFALLTKVYQ